MHRRDPIDSHIVHNGLHSSVAYGLSRLLALRPGDRVLDPCCGTASLLLEARDHWPRCTYIGADIDASQLEKARINSAALASRSAGNSLSLVRGDCASLPVQDGSVDAVVSDLPFGKAFGSVASNQALFPRLLRELGRLLANRGRAVLLTSTESALALTEPASLKAAGLALHAAFPTRHCNLQCVAALLTRAGDAGDALFDTRGVEYGEQGPWLSWRRDQLVSV